MGISCVIFCFCNRTQKYMQHILGVFLLSGLHLRVFKNYITLQVFSAGFANFPCHNFQTRGRCSHEIWGRTFPSGVQRRSLGDEVPQKLKYLPSVFTNLNLDFRNVQSLKMIAFEEHSNAQKSK